MTDPKVYPLTAKFEDWARDELKQLGPIPAATVRYSLWDIYKHLKENLHEYEHGTTDVEVVFENLGLDLSRIDDDDERRRLCLRLYCAVLEDLLLTFINRVQ
jgi:hypothetical protein